MDLKARLTSLEHQINALQAKILTQQPTINADSSDGLNNLKQVLIKLKQEHQSVLDSINQALRLVESSPMSSSPSQQHSHAHCASSSPYTQQQQPLLHSSSPTTARLRDRISAVCASTPPRQTIRPLPSTSGPSSSPLTASVEKSHITFEILRDVENQSSSRLNRSPAAKPTRHVHFSGSSELDLSQASQEYLRKYNLLQ